MDRTSIIQLCGGKDNLIETINARCLLCEAITPLIRKELSKYTLLYQDTQQPTTILSKGLDIDIKYFIEDRMDIILRAVEVLVNNISIMMEPYADIGYFDVILSPMKGIDPRRVEFVLQIVVPLRNECGS